MIAEDLGDDEQRLQISASMTSMAVIATGRSSSQRALLVVSSGVQFLLHFDAVENRRNRRNRQKKLDQTHYVLRGSRVLRVLLIISHFCFLAASCK